MNKKEGDPPVPDKGQAYEDALQGALADYQSLNGLSAQRERQIVKTAKFRSKGSTILITLAILLLIMPVLTLGSYLYYAGKANHMLDLTAKAVYVTEPNQRIDSRAVREQIGLFSMDAEFTTLKRVGKEDLRSTSYLVHFSLDRVTALERNPLLEAAVPEILTSDNNYFILPQGQMTFDQGTELEVLQGLPAQTVAEVYVSLKKAYTQQEIEEALPADTDPIWFAVDTGDPAQMLDSQGLFTPPLGYPAQTDKDYWSPFFSVPGEAESNQDKFLTIVQQLAENEALATAVSRGKSLSLPDRAAYLQSHGVKIYGLVITGPVNELQKLEQHPMVRAMKVRDTRLWNWHS
ncbi:anti sigma factor C-terminal domain-containing protein [Paenibacillus albidus]|uniref:anti-sigma factor n=1 Tax=Paenibacillus albidus TaxID=2041023 RepID=UPI001BE6777E|nr:anti-sigma factor [Paenibacillus albidus]MBT2292877.1 anti sigma factor C-terminal domain-containing protein [Paenibacillus albidus]